MLHEHDNHWELWYSLLGAFKCRLAKTCMRTMVTENAEAHYYQKQGQEIWVRMRNIPRTFYIKGDIVSTMRRTSSSSETNSDTYQRKKTVIYY